MEMYFQTERLAEVLIKNNAEVFFIFTKSIIVFQRYFFLKYFYSIYLSIYLFYIPLAKGSDMEDINPNNTSCDIRGHKNRCILGRERFLVIPVCCF